MLSVTIFYCYAECRFVMLSVVSPGRGPNRKYNTKVCPQRQRQRKRSFIRQKPGDNVLKLFTAVS